MASFTQAKFLPKICEIREIKVNGNRDAAFATYVMRSAQRLFFMGSVGGVEAGAVSGNSKPRLAAFLDVVGENLEEVTAENQRYAT